MAANDDSRPSPETLLKLAQAEEDEADKGTGETEDFSWVRCRGGQDLFHVGSGTATPAGRS